MIDLTYKDSYTTQFELDDENMKLSVDLKQSLETFVSGLKDNKPNEGVKKMAKGAENAVKNSNEILKPLKVKQAKQ